MQIRTTSRLIIAPYGLSLPFWPCPLSTTSSELCPAQRSECVALQAIKGHMFNAPGQTAAREVEMCGGNAWGILLLLSA